MPPEPIITRWGARSEAAIFCALYTSFFVPYPSTKEKTNSDINIKILHN
jgi:hypothetical protein